MRFYDVNGGSIKVSGTDIRDVTRASLRGSYGMVLQDTWLRAGTVRENIAYGKPDATMDEVIAAAKLPTPTALSAACPMATTLSLQRTAAISVRDKSSCSASPA